jgi:predicted GNAT family acetyltransferase
MIRIQAHADARAFLDRAETWLLAQEERYGLVLGIAYQVLGGVHRYRRPIYWATVEDGSGERDAKIVGCVFRTPPHNVGVTELSDAAIEPLVSSLRETYLSVSGVGGPERTASGLARAWIARFGGKWSLEHRQRLHSLAKVRKPSTPAPGHLRLALPADVPVARAWMAGFIRETRSRHVGADTAARLIEQRRLHLWVNGEPRCMVGAVRETPNTAGVAAVYTPPPFRNHGYASVAVATLSQQLLNMGKRSCFLYTDLANPVSNSIYRRVGYEPVDDVVEIMIL